MSAILNYVWSAVLPSAPQSNAEKLRQRFGNNATAAAVYKEYFSAYEKNLLPVDDAILSQIERIVQRKGASTAISQEWQRIILGEDGLALDTTHREIPNESLLYTALDAQVAFEKELTKLKTIDCFQVLRQSVVIPQLNLLKRANSKWASYRCFAPRFTAPEKELIDELRKKANHFGKTFNEQVQESIQMKEGLLQEIDGRIAAVRAQKLAPDEEIWLDPASPKLLKLFELSRQQASAEPYDSLLLHPSLRNHCVLAIGDPIKDPEAQFLIVKRPEDMPNEVWKRFISAENTDDLRVSLQQAPAKPNESFPIKYMYNEKIYTVEGCYEKASDTLQLHENRDLWQKTRRKVMEPGKFIRTNAPEKTDAVPFMKNLWRKLTSDNWSEHREATAGPDCHEAITMNRNMIVKILSGNFQDISQSVAQNLGEYFNALPVADVAHLTGSYLQDYNFLQAERLHGRIYQQEKELFQAGMVIPYLQRAAQESYEWKKDGPRFDQLTHNVFEIYGAWSISLEQFLQELDLPKNQKIKEAFGAELVAELGKFLIDLKHFVANAPHLEIRPVIAARKALKEMVPAPATLMKDLDQVWTNWKRGKTSQEIERILSETCAAIDRGLEALSPKLLNVSVPFSSPQMQGEIAKAMNTNPALMPLFTKAIPPIWQNKARLSLVRKELTEGTELSPTWLAEVQMLSRGDSRLLENEFERSRRAKIYIGSRRRP
jgi:hypothetical protein